MDRQSIRVVGRKISHLKDENRGKMEREFIQALWKSPKKKEKEEIYRANILEVEGW